MLSQRLLEDASKGVDRATAICAMLMLTLVWQTLLANRET